MKRYVFILFVIFLLHNLVGCSSNNRNTDINNSSLTPQPTEILTEITSIEPSQPTQSTAPDFIELQNLNEIYNNLSNICKKPRAIGTKEIINTQHFISNKMKDYGYEVKFQDFSFNNIDRLERMHTRTADDYLSIQFKDGEKKNFGTNIIANKKIDNNYKNLYLCAHYDTTSDTNGEIDNGSGVVTILDIARKISQYKLPINVIFIFFSAEETGMSGSCYFISNLSEKEKNQTIGCINIDCVCQNRTDSEIYMNIPGVGENALSLSMDKFHSFKYGQSGSSDHMSFFYGGIPTISFTDSPYTVKDDENNKMKNIDIEKINDFSNILVNYLCEFNYSEYKRYSEIEYKIDYSQKVKELSFLDYTLQELSQKTIKKGSRSKTVYHFKNNNGNTINFTKDNIRFISSKERDKLKNGKEYHGLSYYVNKTTEGIELHYCELLNNNYYGILSGNIDEQDALKLIESAEEAFQSEAIVCELIIANHNRNK